MGLLPRVAVTEGHAICGVCLQPQTLQSLITDVPAELRKHIDLKELLLFETTLVTHEPPKKFSKAIETANGEIAEAVEDKFVHALDIARARQQQISPLGIERVVKEGDTAGGSEERRVGKGCVSTCRSRWSPSRTKKKKKK